jgi:hypothetical protein
MGSCRFPLAVLPAYRLGWVSCLLLLEMCASRNVFAWSCRLPLSLSHAGADVLRGGDRIRAQPLQSSMLYTSTNTIHPRYRSKN